jgi:hypothetical protein
MGATGGDAGSTGVSTVIADPVVDGSSTGTGVG